MIWFLLRRLKASSWEKRVEAAMELGEKGDARAVDGLTSALFDNDSRVQVAAAEALGKIGDERAVSELTVALEDPWKSVRLAAVDSLLKLNWQPENLAQRIRFALARCDANACIKEGPSAIPALISRLLETDNRQTLEEIAAILVKFGNDAHQPLLRLFTDKNSRISELHRRTIADILGGIGQPAALLDAISFSVRFDLDAFSDLQLTAISAMKKMGTAGARLLTERLLLLKSHEWEQRFEIAKMLGRLDNREAIGPLLKLLLYQNPEVQKAAINSLQQTEPQWTALPETRAMLPSIIELLKNGETGALWLLKKIDPAWSQSDPVRTATAASLMLILYKQWDRLDLVTESLDHVFRLRDVDRIEIEKAIRGLEGTLAQITPDFRFDAKGNIAEKWTRSDEARAIVPLLIPLLKTGLPDDRKAAISILGQIPDGPAIESLIEVLQDPNSLTVLKEEAACALLELDYCGAGLPVLEAAMHNHRIVLRFLYKHPGKNNFARQILKLTNVNDKIHREIETIWQIRADQIDPWGEVSEALLMIGGPVATEVAILRAKDDNYYRALDGMHLLTSFNNEKTLDVLCDIISNPVELLTHFAGADSLRGDEYESNTEHRILAARELARRGGPKALAALQLACKDMDTKLRGVALELMKNTAQ